MISAKLIKNLEKIGFSLEFPGYAASEEMIKEILEENNPRLDLALPLLLEEGIDYEALKNRLKPNSLKKLNRIISLAKAIFEKEGIKTEHLDTAMKAHKIKEIPPEQEISTFSDAFREAKRKFALTEEKEQHEQLKLRSILNTNKAIAAIFSPAKMSIMDKIYRHEPLSNTELKYYYRAIKPLCSALINDNLQNYARIIETSKKYWAS